MLRCKKVAWGMPNRKEPKYFLVEFLQEFPRFSLKFFPLNYLNYGFSSFLAVNFAESVLESWQGGACETVFPKH
jgi:hypothetical protein